MNTHFQQELIRRGLATIGEIQSSEERADFMDAAADMIIDPKLSERCRVTASCLREAEQAQLRLFQSIRPA